MRDYFVYIATNYDNTVLYTGMTNNIDRRAFEHKSKLHRESFTANYNVFKIVHIEVFHRAKDAITREKAIKGWRRERKIELIEVDNPEWRDLLFE